MDKVEIFIKRLEKIGINVKLGANYPWIYIDEINGKRITKKYQSEYGFTLAFLPIRKEQELQFTNISEIFKLIRNEI